MTIKINKTCSKATQCDSKKLQFGSSSVGSLIIIAFISVLLMSLVPVIIKWIDANPATIGIVRLTIAVIGLVLLALALRQRIICNRTELFWLIFLGFVFAVHWYTYFLSIKLATASLAAIGVATFGIHLLILSSLIKNEKIQPSDWLAISLSFVGIIIASPKLNVDFNQLQGFMLAILSGFLYACLPLINQRISHLNTNTRAIGQFGFALLFFLFLLPSTNFNLKPTDWYGLLALGILSTLIAHTLWIKITTELPTNLTSVIYYSYIPISIVLSVIFLAEEMTWQKILGALMIISANLLVMILHKKAAPKKR